MMKIVKYIFAGTVVFLLFIAPFFFVSFVEAFDKIELLLLLISFGLMVLLAFLNFKESIEKMENMANLNVRFTRGLAYCLCSLPYLRSLAQNPYDDPFWGWQIMLYLLTLFFAIFNYGIEVKQANVKER